MANVARKEGGQGAGARRRRRRENNTGETRLPSLERTNYGSPITILGS